MFNLSPSVDFTEIDLTQFISASAGSTGGLVADVAWGPINEVTLVTSEESLVNIFGEPTDTNYADWFTAANFLAYTDNLKLVRVADASALNARMFGTLAVDPGTGGTQIKNNTDFDASLAAITTAAGTPFVARYAGALGNTFSISYTQNAEFDTWAFKQAFAQKPTGFELAVVVVIDSVVVESFLVSSRAGFKDGFGQNNFMDDVINSSSRYIYSISANLFTPDFQFAQAAPDSAILTGFNALTVPAPDTTIDLTAGSASVVIPTTATALTIGADVVGTKIQVTSGANINEVYTVVAILTDGTTDVTLTLDRSAVATQSLNVNTAGTPNSVEENRFSSTSSATAFLGELELFKDGADATTVSAAEVIAGWGFMDGAEEVDISLVMEGGAKGDTTKTIATHIIQNVCEIRKDCVGFISPLQTDVVASATPVTSLLATRALLPSSTYGFMDGNYKYQFDRYNDTFRWVPFNGDMAGLAARTDATNGPWWSPAGYNRGIIKNVTKVAFSNSKKAQRDDLYTSQINPIIQEAGSGTLLLGDKTLQAKTSAFSFINVRRLFITLEKSIANAAKFNLFEFNDEFTRARFVQTVTPFLRDVQGQRGITEFRVVADETVNTPQVVNAAEFRANILIKPNRSINFINLTFTAVAEGVSFDEVVAN